MDATAKQQQTQWTGGERWAESLKLASAAPANELGSRILDAARQAVALHLDATVRASLEKSQAAGLLRLAERVRGVA